MDRTLLHGLRLSPEADQDGAPQAHLQETQPPIGQEQPRQKPSAPDPGPSATSDDWEKRFKGQSRVVSEQAEKIKALSEQLAAMQRQYEALQTTLAKAAGIDKQEDEEASPDPVELAMRAVQQVEELQKELRRKDLETMKLKLLPPELHEFADDIPTPDDPEELAKRVKAFTKKMEKFVKQKAAPNDPIQSQRQAPPSQSSSSDTAKNVDATTALNNWMKAVERGDEENARKWSKRYLELSSAQNRPSVWSDITAF